MLANGKSPMKQLTFAAAVGVIAWVLAAQGAAAQTVPTADDRPSASSDDIGEDGLKRRGDGSIDDDQPGAEGKRPIDPAFCGDGGFRRLISCLDV